MEGPILSDLAGDLDKPTLFCWTRDHRCEHLVIVDHSYPYCKDQAVPENSRMWPDPKRGTSLGSCEPNSACRFIPKEQNE